MYIPIEYLLGIVLITVLAIGLVVKSLWRRIAFWRYALISASDMAFRQLESMKEDVELMVEEDILKPENVPFGCLGGKRIAQLCGKPDGYYDSELDLSAEQRYTRHIDSLLKLCKEQGYCWVTQEDKHFPLK
ncbi:MAG: hypothetical protein RPU32_12565 [Candidatus Sedimenticola sp. (ex Thyasira tokunagai)]